MAIKFHTGIKQIQEASKPIAKAWELSLLHLELDSKTKKIMEILGDHENLFINYNPYHNHYHFAEVIWGSAFLAKKEKIEEKYLESMVILLLAATFHDSDHPGRANKNPFEIEQKSADFFKSWWKNNSLFVENILPMPPSNIEQAVRDLILFTDFSHGVPKVITDYLVRRENESFGLKINKLKKILNEADILMNCLPHSGFKKTVAILGESVRQMPDETKWLMMLSFLQENAPHLFTSDACKELKIDSLVRKFTQYLEENKHLMKDGIGFQEEINAKFKQF